MSDATPKVWQQAKLLNLYYQKVGLAAAGKGSCPRFTEFRAGFGLVDETDLNNPKLLNIPPNLTEVPNEFYRDLVEVEYSDGVTLCKCEIPLGAVGTPVRHNLIGVCDQDSDLVAVCTTLPDWVTPSELYRSFPAVKFPLEPEPEPEPVPDPPDSGEENEVTA